MMKILALAVGIILLVGVLPLSLASSSCQVPTPTDILGESGVAIAKLIASVLPEMLWAFMRSFICGGLLPGLVELPKVFFDVAPTGTLLGLSFGLISCGLGLIPGCILGMYYDSAYWA